MTFPIQERDDGYCVLLGTATVNVDSKADADKIAAIDDHIRAFDANGMSANLWKQMVHCAESCTHYKVPTSMGLRRLNGLVDDYRAQFGSEQK
jgi:hypothetical protein